MGVEIVRASPAHVGTIAARMRPVDRREAGAFGHSPKQALRGGLLASDEAWTAKVDGRAEAMFGIVTVSAIDRTARPWFLGTDEVYRHGRLLLVVGRRLVARWLDSSTRLEQVVASENARAIALLRRWGFTVGETETMIGGMAFRHFWRER